MWETIWAMRYVFQGVFFISKVFSVVSYLLMAYGLYTIAKRRLIGKSWLAWFPVLQLWVLGSISDHYQQEVNHRRGIKRWLLIIVNVLVSIADSMTSKSFMTFFVELFRTGAESGSLGSLLLPFLGCALALGILSIVLAVLRYFALYDLYKSCNPSKRMVFLLLSIFVGIVQPFLVCYCRNQDLGLHPPQPIEE